MSQPEVCEWFTAVREQAFSQGARGVSYEAGLYRRDWGLDLSQVDVDTHLFYGGADQTVPASAGRWLADRLPNSTYVEWPQHGHFTWMRNDEAAEVVTTLTSGVELYEP